MKASASIELVWQIATQEAVAAEFAEIEPEHFLAAILKFSELPVDQVGNLAPGADAVREMATAVGKVREELQRRAIDSTRVRRELRVKLGNGGSPPDGGPKHRSQASRDMFDAAARMADEVNSEVLVPGGTCCNPFCSRPRRRSRRYWETLWRQSRRSDQIRRCWTSMVRTWLRQRPIGVG